MYAHENCNNLYHICCFNKKKKCFSEVWKQILNSAFNWKKKENLSLVLNNIPMTYNITSREKKESCGKILLHWDLAI